MAAQTIRSELGFVHIGMARRTSIAGLAEFQILVTTRAGNRLVLTVEHESRLGVIEARVGAHFPRISGMAGLTWDFDIPVGRFLGNTNHGA